MPKQILEGIFLKSAKAEGLWIQKFYNVHITRTPADFIVCTNKGHYLVECKETKDGRYAFSRTTQEDQLIDFYERNFAVDGEPINSGIGGEYINSDGKSIINGESIEVGFSFNSFICILFRQRMLKNSCCFLIPYNEFLRFIGQHDKKSCNVEDLAAYFGTKYMLYNKLGRSFTGIAGILQ